MLKDKNIEFELSKLQKKIDKKKTGTTTIINNSSNGDQSNAPVTAPTILGKPVATDMTAQDGQTLVYNKDKKQWEPGTVTGEADLTDYYTKTETNALIPTVPDQLSDLTEDATHRTVTDTEKTTWNAKASALGADDNYVTDLEKAKLPQQIIFTYNL